MSTAMLSWWFVVAAVVLVAARDLVLYPAMRVTFRPASPTRPIGARGVAVAELRPSGMVRVHGELWQAQVVGGVVAADQAVIVTGAVGLTLVVERADLTSGPSPASPCTRRRSTGRPP